MIFHVIRVRHSWLLEHLCTNPRGKMVELLYINAGQSHPFLITIEHGNMMFSWSLVGNSIKLLMKLIVMKAASWHAFIWNSAASDRLR